MKHLIVIFCSILIIIFLSYAVYNATKEINNSKTNIEHKYDYSINYFIDTIDGHVILSTVCEEYHNVSISTLELNSNDTINVR